MASTTMVGTPGEAEAIEAFLDERSGPPAEAETECRLAAEAQLLGQVGQANDDDSIEFGPQSKAASGFDTALVIKGFTTRIGTHEFGDSDTKDPEHVDEDCDDLDLDMMSQAHGSWEVPRHPIAPLATHFGSPLVHLPD